MPSLPHFPPVSTDSSPHEVVSSEQDKMEKDQYVVLAQSAVAAAEQALTAARADTRTPEEVKVALARTVEASSAVVFALLDGNCTPSSRRQRQPFAEFATMLGEEVKEAAGESIEEAKRNAERTLRKAKSLIEDHFHIDDAFRMLGPLTQDSNWSRDVHDAFNLVALIPVIFFNLINWRLAPLQLGHIFSKENGLTSLWHGDSFLVFWWVTFSYFVVDLCWMLILPNSVKSPGVIIKHHIVTLGYIFIPKFRPEVSWLMGCCMIVEVNTWFLIARRVFNKKGDRPFSSGVPLPKSFRLMIVSTCFYLSWFVIRLVVYPILLPIIISEYVDCASRVGTPFNIILVAPMMHLVFLYLNAKWTIDLIRSKIKRNADKGASKHL